MTAAPTKCMVCGRPVPDLSTVCTACAATLAPVARAGIAAVARKTDDEADRAFAAALFGAKA